MKRKLLCAVCVLLSMVLLTTGVLAAETYADMDALYQYWSRTEWPSWVCSVSSTDGSDRLTVVVNSQWAAEELAAMVEDDSTLRIIVSEEGYTHNELLLVHEEIVDAYLKPAGESPVVKVGIGWIQVDGEVVGFGESNRETRVVVGVLADSVEEYRGLFWEKYGDMVYVEASGRISTTTGRPVAADGPFREDLGLETPSPYTWYLWGLAALVCVVAALVLYRSRTAVVRTTKGRSEEVFAGETAETPAGKPFRRMPKRLLIVCAAMVLLACLVWAGIAFWPVKTYSSIDALYNHWSTTRYPDWVCSVRSTYGFTSDLTVVVDSQKAAERLAAMVEDESTLTIVVWEDGYTNRELRQLRDKIFNRYMKWDAAIRSVGIGGGYGESGVESRVVVGILEGYAEEYRTRLQKKYGDIVVVESVSGSPEDFRAAYSWDFSDLSVLLIAVVVVVLLRSCHWALIVRTRDGRKIGAGEILTARQLEDAVAEMNETPDGKVYQRILKKLNEPEELT